MTCLSKRPLNKSQIEFRIAFSALFKVPTTWLNLFPDVLLNAAWGDPQIQQQDIEDINAAYLSLYLIKRHMYPATVPRHVSEIQCNCSLREYIIGLSQIIAVLTVCLWRQVEQMDCFNFLEVKVFDDNKTQILDFRQISWNAGNLRFVSYSSLVLRFSISYDSTLINASCRLLIPTLGCRICSAQMKCFAEKERNGGSQKMAIFLLLISSF